MAKACERCGAEADEFDTGNSDSVNCLDFGLCPNLIAWLCRDCRTHWLQDEQAIEMDHESELLGVKATYLRIKHKREDVPLDQILTAVRDIHEASKQLFKYGKNWLRNRT